MANLIYTDFKEQLARGNHAFATDTYYVLLTTVTHVPAATDTTRADIDNEVVGTGYTANGKTIGTVTVTENGTTVEIDAPNVTWTSSTITARWAIIYQFNGGAASGDPLVAAWDFGTDQSSSSGDFTLQFNAAGFLNL